MAGNQVMGMGAGTQSGNNVYPGPYTSNQAPPPNDSGDPPPKPGDYVVKSVEPQKPEAPVDEEAYAYGGRSTRVAGRK